jgi:putative toxin-antitoxin system antitoxin component (TIGR02293 family)
MAYFSRHVTHDTCREKAMAERQHPEHAAKGRSKDGMAPGRAAGEGINRRRAAGFFPASVSVTGGDQIVSWGAGYLVDVSTLLGGRAILGSTIESDLEAHELLHRGLPRGALTSLIEKLHDIPVIEVSEALGMSLRTLQRHKSTPGELLDVQQSGRTWKFAEILAKATRVLGSQDEAEQWLERPAIGLDQQRPLDLLTTPAGVKLVEDYLGRLEYNVYT